MAFIVGFLPPADPEFDFQMPAEKVELQGDQRKALLVDFLLEFADFLLPGEQFAHPQGVVIVDIALLEGTDMHVVHIQLAVFDGGVGILQVDFPGPGGLDFRSAQRNADLERLEHEVLVPCSSVGQNMPDSVLLCVHSSDPRTELGKNTESQKKKDRGTIASDKIFVYIYESECGANPAFFIISRSERTHTLQSHIEPLIESAGARLVEMIFHPQGRRHVLELFVDTETGVTADLLAELSRTIGAQIDEKGWITDSYQLVVSSPGLERPLRQPWQFRRHANHSVLLTVIEGGVKREVSGRILEATDEQVLISQGEGALAIPFERIEHAMIQATL